MGRTNGIIAVGKRDECRAKGITIYIDFNNHKNAFTDTNAIVETQSMRFIINQQAYYM